MALKRVGEYLQCVREMDGREKGCKKRNGSQD